MKQLGFLLIVFWLIAAPTRAQSTNENFPTPVNANEISGTIVARDVGDARLTRHFYTFFVDNGDIDLKIETANFDGDIDVFEANTLRPLLKVTVYDGAAVQPARTIYFRKREQVVLRVEGRTLTDDAATYRINFGGSFAAAADLPQPPENAEPTVTSKPSAAAVARVNSAGAIIEVLPSKKTVETAIAKSAPETIEPQPDATATAATAALKPARTTRRARPTRGRTRPAPTAANDKPADSNTNSNASENPNSSGNKTANVNSSSSAKTNETTNTNETATANETTKPLTTASDRAAARRAARTARSKTANSRPRNGQTRAQPSDSAAVAAAQPDPLANLRLIVLMKNSDRVERSMSDVFRVSVDSGQLTIITKSGKIERYNLAEIIRFAIE